MDVTAVHTMSVRKKNRQRCVGRKMQFGGDRESKYEGKRRKKWSYMKIIILTNHSFMLYQFRKELIEELLKENEVTISVPFGEHVDDFKNMGCKMIDTPVDRRGVNPVTDLQLLNTYYKLLKKERPDRVITYSIKPNIYGGMVCRLLKIPYSVNVQGLGTAFQKKGLAQVATLMYRAALKKVSVVFFENQGNASVFCNKKIIHRDKITVLPGAGINLDYYSYQPYKEEGKVRFLYLGRIMKEKGVEEFFQAARKMKAYYGNEVAFDVVGFFEDEYKEIVETLQKEEIIHFHGFQSETRPYYGAANCVVLPSYHEGMSNVLLEAAAVGRAIITSDIPGCREAVDDGVSGSLCPVKDAEQLFAEMKDFMEKGQAAREKMGLNGRKKMEMEFDKKKVVRMTVAALRG